MNEYQFKNGFLNQSTWLPQQQRLLVEADQPLNQNSKGIKHLQRLDAIHYVSLTILFIIMIILLYIIKRYFIKFINFYIIKQDYRQIKPIIKNQENITEKENKTFKVINYKKMNFRQKINMYKESLISNLVVYHPVFYFMSLKIKQFKKQKLPFQIFNGLSLLSLIILLSFSILTSRINSSICQINMFKYYNLYTCQQTSNNNIEDNKQWPLAILSIIITLIFVLSVFYYFTRNYFKFLEQVKQNSQIKLHEPNEEAFQEEQIQITQVKEEFQNEENKVNISPTKQQNVYTSNNFDSSNQDYKTQHQMLSRCDIESRKTNKNSDKKQNKKLYQINEEEEPFSASKNNYSDVQIDDTNTKMRIDDNNQALQVNKNISNIGKKLQYDDGIKNVVILDPPQFCSQNKGKENDENLNNSFRNQEMPKQSLQNAYSQATLQTNEIKSQLGNYTQRPKSHLKHMKHQHYSNKNSLANIQTSGMLSDSTTMIDPKIQGNLSSKMLLADQNELQDLELDMQNDLDLEKQRSQKASKLLGINTNPHSQRSQVTGQLNTNRLSINPNQQLQNSGRDCFSQGSKEESKDDESSRILMMINGEINSSSRESLIAQHDKSPKRYSKKQQILLILLLIFMFFGILLCCGFITYSFYNMTTLGIQNSLSIFGIAVFLDILIFRVAAIAIISLLTTIYQLKELQQKQQDLIHDEIDEEQLCLLGEIYEDYNAPLQYVPNSLIYQKGIGSPQEYKNYLIQQKLGEINSMDHPDYQTLNEQNSSPKSYSNTMKSAQYREYQFYLNYQKQQTMQLNEKINLRLSKVNQNQKKGRNFGEIVLVDATYFYHQPQNMPLSMIKEQVKEFNIEQQNQNEQTQNSKKMISLGERLQISNTLQFNAVEEELRMRQAHAEKLRKQHQDHSNYDIEEIPMNSAQKQKLPEYINPYMDEEMNPISNNNLNLPPIFPQQHQFETPKGMQNTRVQFQMPNMPGVNISQKIITFNDVRDSKQDSQVLPLQEIIASGYSNSSKKNKALQINGKDYHSLQRYLDDDKENQNSNNKSGKKSFGLRDSLFGSNKRQNKYLDENQNHILSPQYQDDPQSLNVLVGKDEIIKFTPQYNSLIKHKTIDHDKENLNRKSLVLPELFSDIKGSSILPQLQSNKNKSRKSSKNSRKSQMRQSLNVKTLLNARKSIQSPSSIKENLEERMNKLNQNNIASIKQQSLLKSINKQPDISPFNDNKYHQNRLEINNDDTYIEPPTLNIPSPRDFNVMQSIDFNMPEFQQQNQFENQVNDSRIEPKFRESVSQNIRQFLQPQLLQQKTTEKVKNRANKKHNNITTEGSQNDSTIQLNFQNELQDKVDLLNTDNQIKDKEDQNDLQDKDSKRKQKILPKKQRNFKKLTKDFHFENKFGNTFQTELNSKPNQSSFMDNTNDNLYNLDNLIEDDYDINQSIHDKNDDNSNRNDNGQMFEEQSFKSKLFEDSDSSTIRMIKIGGLGSRQRSKQALTGKQEYQTQQDVHTEVSSNLVNTSQGGAIDFYSAMTGLPSLNSNINEERKKSNNKLVQDYKCIKDNKKSKQYKDNDIIVEENLQTHNSSPEKNPQIAILDDNSQEDGFENKTSKKEDKKILQHQQHITLSSDGFNNMMDAYDQFQQNTNEESQCEDTLSQAQESNFAQPFLRRQVPNSNNRYRSNLRPGHSNGRDLQARDKEHSGTDYDSSFVTNKLRQQDDLKRQKEDNELLQLRIEDQRRKLKNFLKLAKQLKSIKDEKKIKEFLKYLKNEQKPLPYSKINELKSLEIMSSPYNQSLIDMIKDEYDQFKKNDRKQKNNAMNTKPSKSQQRSEIKTGQKITKLSGIYGQQVGNSSYSTHRKESSRGKSRGDSQQVELRSKKLLQQNQQSQERKLVHTGRQIVSRGSSNSVIDIPMQQFKRKQQRNNVNILIGGNTTQSIGSNDDFMSITQNTNQQNNATGSYIRVENIGNVTSDEEQQLRGRKRNLLQNQVLEIRDSNEFNNLEDYM